MVRKDEIIDALDYVLLRKSIEDIVVKKYLEVVKCSSNSATKAGDGANVHMADDHDGVRVPLRRLQHKGFDEEGNDLGYIADISYPNGTIIDYYNGSIHLEGFGDEFDGDYPMGFFDNYRDGDHVTRGSANGLFKQQWKDLSRDDRAFLLNYLPLMKRGSLVRQLKALEEEGIDVNDATFQSYLGDTPLGKLVRGKSRMDEVIGHTLSDGQGLVVGEQVEKMNSIEGRRINYSSDDLTSTSVGFLNDKTLSVRDSVTGDSRSVNGKVNNWDNTTKVYTLIRQGDGTHALYLGYGQNVVEGAFDNSGNPHNELTFGGGQRFRRLLVDVENNVVIQVPVNE